MDILDIRQFRVRVFTSHPLVVRRVSEISGEDSEWRTFDELDQCFDGKFADRNPLNIPGPFYGAETDTCLTGVVEAPQNILVDQNGQEFIGRQPVDATELAEVVVAAWCDPFSGYGADGDRHWRLSLIREWWATRHILRIALVHESSDPSTTRLWRQALAGEAEDYLRRYAFFVENGRAPRERDVLPELE